MLKACLLGVLTLFAAVGMSLAEDEEQENTLSLSDCPRAVQKTLKREANGSEVEEISKEEEDGKTVYEAEAEIDGKDYEIEVAEDGTLLSKTLEDDEDDEEEADDDDGKGGKKAKDDDDDDEKGDKDAKDDDDDDKGGKNDKDDDGDEKGDDDDKGGKDAKDDDDDDK